ncbi:MAG TPA: energy transducer TonB [Gemmatimonadaceae bacterium]|nr:energy transducer TonB [Gemmatimonadaceae bacterium]
MMPPLLSRTALVAALAVAAPLAAQAPAPAPSCPAPLEPIGNSYAQDTLLLVLDPGYGLAPQPENVQQSALAAVFQGLELPTPLPLPVVITRLFANGGSMAGSQGFTAEAFVEIGGNGKVKRTGLSQTSLVPPIDQALLTAVTTAADSGAFEPYQKAARGPGGFVFVELRTVDLPAFDQKVTDYLRQPDPMVAPRRRPPPKGEPARLPIKLLRIPLMRLTSQAEVPKPGPHPVFPQRELDANQDGFVNFEFVIGADGRLVPGTLRIANSMTPGYARAVLKAVEDFKFVPATAGGCGVAQREVWTFNFEVR